ncbi:MAG TPA: hypothetical protein VK870_02070 [Ignavibacteriaceae bacterium]|nr:hypothetical protein [Ignavibacteriaceae bacterium]
MKKFLSLVTVTLITVVIINGCESGSSIDNPVATDQYLDKGTGLTTTESQSSFSPTLNKELALARASSAKYHDINTALADGYMDINLYIPNMGWHFLNPAYVDGNFEIDKPELLVYANKPGGGYRLVAVEYAVPLSFPTPEGFTGDEDVWSENIEAGLWTLHAWVWLHNPDGIFSPYNVRVP